MFSFVLGGVAGAISFLTGAPLAVPVVIGCVLFFGLMFGAGVSYEMNGRYRVYYIAAFGLGLALGALITANPH